MSVDIDSARAEIAAPAKAMRGGMDARYLRSTTSESRPTIGERTLCIRRGPWKSQSLSLCYVWNAYLNDPSYEGWVSKVSNDECYHVASSNDHKHLRHDAEACKLCVSKVHVESETCVSRKTYAKQEMKTTTQDLHPKET